MTIRSKTTLAVIAATLALSSMGSAFAQDRNHQDRDGRDGRYDQRHDGRHDNGRGNDDRGNYRHDDRNDRNDYRDGRHYDRPGYPQPHAEWKRGGRVPTEYRGRNYVVNDYRDYHLNAPPRGYQWVGVGGDYVLAAIATGIIAQIIVGQ